MSHDKAHDKADEKDEPKAGKPAPRKTGLSHDEMVEILKNKTGVVVHQGVVYATLEELPAPEDLPGASGGDVDAARENIAAELARLQTRLERLDAKPAPAAAAHKGK